MKESPSLPVPLDFRKPAPQDFRGGDHRQQLLESHVFFIVSIIVAFLCK